MPAFCLTLVLLMLVYSPLASAGWLKSATIEINAVQRHYAIAVPAVKPRALLMVLHGGGGDGKGVARYTGFQKLAEKYALLLVYPDGWQGHWNDGRKTTENGRDDVAFLARLAADLGEQYQIPQSRRFLTGLSNGGFMSWRIACESPQSFSAISPVMASMPAAQAFHCPAAAGVNLLAIIGNADPIVPWSGGEVKKGRSSGKGGRVMGAVKTFSFWQKKYACKPPISKQSLPDKNKSDDSRAILWRAKGCRDSLELELLELDNAGHNWPGRKHGWLMRRITGNVNMDIDTGLFMLGFFNSKPEE